MDSTNEPERDATVDERIKRVRKLRKCLPDGGFSPEEILQVIREGRERYSHFVNGEVVKHPPMDARSTLEG